MKAYWLDFMFRMASCLACLIFGFYLGKMAGREDVQSEWQTSRIYADAVATADFAPGATNVHIPTTLGRQAAVECWQIKGRSQEHSLMFLNSITVGSTQVAVAFEPAVNGGKCVLRRRSERHRGGAASVEASAAVY